MKYLSEIIVCLPDKDKKFSEQFIHFLSSLGKTSLNTVDLYLSKDNFLPQTSFQFIDKDVPCVVFNFDDGSEIRIDITNVTNVTKESSYKYESISFDTFISRVPPFPIVGLDHIGFNLPYFEGVHPTLLKLREELKNTCLYHTFPKHLEDEPWDFIIPGTTEEIDRSVSVDYNQTRKPKFELVSFENCSTPLVQIDVQLKGTYEDKKKVFPEAIHDDFLRNMWVYIENDFGIDICFVLGEVSERDWSFEFAKERI
ncbi:MAG: hypothetical protein A3F33_00635 [Candidatus Woykebacteria bacterium RIFCSPHIGHO2_12_FULL_43_10]|uniref:Uncharacterized protein n=2 Tax=Candidatus Woykeibacteriota TaxID=1817899 RepID=A0A1G1WYG2_9BACT|nr:MAG: hypothetical protein A3F33_00635 [Candidatus Woykebacteria bacterium RIFCSPHIGHO2_12_FULL_43_10]OGY28745.1 MAG: hypothetical protein A3J50_01370 [Candidatus Woykebacteria bacterium RIFCSPHIGHO2_02_FULL_43_16b]OGY32796.1 MAG: hypothetical protein A3A61_03325 [Candidatus Woykebacteria bacterium RIFCSPLOWO2_01_FULL_43_14]